MRGQSKQQKNGIFAEIMVSTDSNEYKEIAERYGANVPFLRSAENSSDKSSSWDAIREVLVEYDTKLGKSFDSFCMLQPTSPLRSLEDIDGAIEKFVNYECRSLLSVSASEVSPIHIRIIENDGKMTKLLRWSNRFVLFFPYIPYYVNLLQVILVVACNFCV